MSVDLSDLINSVMRKLAEFQRTFLTHGNLHEHTWELKKTNKVHRAQQSLCSLCKLTPRIFSSPRVTGLLPSFSLQSWFIEVALRIHLLSRSSIRPPEDDERCDINIPTSATILSLLDLDYILLTLMVIQDSQCNFISPRGAFLESNSVSRSSKQFSSRDQVTISK